MFLQSLHVLFLTWRLPTTNYPVSLMSTGSATGTIDGSWSYLIGLKSLFAHNFGNYIHKWKRSFLLCTFPIGERAHNFTQLNLVYVRWYWATKVYFLIFSGATAKAECYLSSLSGVFLCAEWGHTPPRPNWHLSRTQLTSQSKCMIPVTWQQKKEDGSHFVVSCNTMLISISCYYFSPERETFVDVVSIMFTISRCSYFNLCTSVSNTLIILLTELGGDADCTTSQVDLSAYSDWCDGAVNIVLSYRQETRTRTWKREPVMSYCARRDIRNKWDTVWMKLLCLREKNISKWT